jgi:hypothetical protein
MFSVYNLIGINKTVNTNFPENGFQDTSVAVQGTAVEIEGFLPFGENCI